MEHFANLKLSSEFRRSPVATARPLAPSTGGLTHASGIRVHTYGPHYFRTNSDELWEFVRRFTSFYPFEVVLKSWVDGQYENWPIAGSYIRRTVGESCTRNSAERPAISKRPLSR